MVLGNDYLYWPPVPGRDYLVKSLDYSAIGRYATDKVDWLFKRSLLERDDHPSNTFTECIKHCFNWDTLLLQVDEVSFGKDTASGGYPGRAALALQRQAGKVVHADAQPVGLLLKEPPRAGSTKGV